MFAPQVFAQAKNFEGFSIGAALNIASSSSTAAGTTASDTDQNLNLNAQYNFAISDKFVLGLGASLELGELKSGLRFGTNQVKQTETNSIFVAPGYVLNSTTLVYGKIAAISATATESASNIKLSLNGVGYGAGIQGFINKNLYWQGELLQKDYSDWTNASGVKWAFKSTAVSLGVGYKF